MSGSRLGRGRGGRLALYAGCGVVVVLLVFLYRAATLEMARLREREIQCTHQQGALAAQLQVIFEYKTRLEKSLAEEKTSNAAVKQELQQRASREKDLRDKDGREAMQRFESLQQTYKMLQSEHQDLKEGCKKQETQALENMNKLEGTLQKLRTHIKQLKEEKETKIRDLEDLKNKYMKIDTDKTRLEETYKDLLKSNSDTDSTIEHLKKVVFQLTRELEEAKKSTIISQRTEQQGAKPAAGSSQQQQVSPPSNSAKNPQPLHAPRNHHAIGDPLESGNQLANEDVNESKIRFAQKNGNIVPVGVNEGKDGESQNSLPLPLLYNSQVNSQKKLADEAKDDENPDEEQLKQVIPPPNQINENVVDKKVSSNSPNLEVPSLKNDDSPD